MKHVPHSTFATSIQKIHTMKADISKVGMHYIQVSQVLIEFFTNLKIQQ